MVKYKIWDKKTKKYRLVTNGVDSLNVPLGYIKGTPIQFSCVDVETMKARESETFKD